MTNMACVRGFGMRMRAGLRCMVREGREASSAPPSPSWHDPWQFLRCVWICIIAIANRSHNRDERATAVFWPKELAARKSEAHILVAPTATCGGSANVDQRVYPRQALGAVLPS